MLLLIVFSFMAGLITILSPCILSILPILLATTSDQTRYKPLGIVLGLILSFSFFTLAATSIVQALGISPDVFRYIAIGTILFFGLSMIIPSLGQWLTQITSTITQLGSGLQNHSYSVKGTDFFSGCILGAALGLIWTPCAGPILATITVLAATQGVSLISILMILAYSFGAAFPMIIIMYSSKAIMKKTSLLSSYGSSIRKFFGLLMIGSAIAIAFDADKKLDISLAHYFPSLSLEKNPLITTELQSLKRGKNVAMDQINTIHAPELVGIADWINSKPLTLKQLRGKVVLIDFWTYSCINCIRTLPHLKRWYQNYKDQGLEIIGVHSPEFAFEKNINHVQNAVDKFGISYPVALDNDYATWQAYDNHYWPAHYLINKEGMIVYHHFGEGNYLDTENKIRNLLGLKPLMGRTQQLPPVVITPETYLGYARADKYYNDIIIQKDKITAYQYKQPLIDDKVGLTGIWQIKDDHIIAIGDNCSITINFIAHTVNLVMESPITQDITVLLDGKSLPTEYYTHDSTKSGRISVHEPRMYELINMKKEYGRHTLTIICPKGVKAYVFTFG